MGTAETEVLGNPDIITSNLHMAAILYVLHMHHKSKMTGYWFVYACSVLLGSTACLQGNLVLLHHYTAAQKRINMLHSMVFNPLLHEQFKEHLTCQFWTKLG